MHFEDEDDDDMFIEGLYENGTWNWDDKTDELVFIRAETSLSDESEFVPASIVATVDFRNDLDEKEQHKFRKKFQRKPAGEDDVITLQWFRLISLLNDGPIGESQHTKWKGNPLENIPKYTVNLKQDVKDLVLYITPLSLLTPLLINLLHQSTTERFLKAIILYCQYFVQTSEEMVRRTLERHKKIYTRKSFSIESQYRENLEDVRVLVAKEYSTLILGVDDLQKYHHKGPKKKLPSLSRRESFLFETLLRITIQIIWISLGRQSYGLIAKEVNRLFKTKYFNVAEHQCKTDSVADMSTHEKYVLLGHCLDIHDNMLKARSPLVSEATCPREFDHRLLGLGVTKYPCLSSRLHYFERVLVAEEHEYATLKVVLGIIGLKRSHFDTMLRPIDMPASQGNASSGSRFSVGRKSKSRTSRTGRASSSMKKSTIVDGPKKLFPDIGIPVEFRKPVIPDYFPSTDRPRKSCNDAQRLKWLSRVKAKGKKCSRHRSIS